jgi:hypothetical protein
MLSTVGGISAYARTKRLPSANFECLTTNEVKANLKCSWERFIKEF